MKFKHIKSDEAEKHNFGLIKVQNLMNTKDYQSLSVAKVELDGDQKFGKDTQSDVAYYILEGEGKFFIEDEEIDDKKGDLVFIPKNTQYKDSGKMTLLAIASPRFDREKRVRFD
ncbi:hypothetical protein JW851_03280 [Candidatus Woesearchaeota archaeon]|nr:hypothetical protein [Candidatus Woesearchaeota archaeon]